MCSKNFLGIVSLCLIVFLYPIHAAEHLFTSQLQMGGYFDTEYLYNQGGNQGFKAHRLILQSGAQLHERITFDAEIEFEYGAMINTTRDDGKIKIEQAWADFTLSPVASIRSGIVLVPFGHLNVFHDSDYRDTTNRPIYGKYMVPTTWSDAGVGLHGEFDLGEWVFHYDHYFINGLADTDSLNDDNISNSKGLRNARPSLKTDNNQNLATATRLAVSPSLGTLIGTSYYQGTTNDSDTDQLSLVGFDFQWKKGPVSLIAEWAESYLEGAGARPQKMNGYYLEGHYHIPLRSKTKLLTKKLDNPVITLFARISVVDLDTSIVDSYDMTQTTIGFNYRPIETMAYKLEYEINREAVSDKANNAVVASIALGF